MSQAEEFRADLHCHSTCSDGSSSPEELVSLALSLGLSGLSITDHDNVAAYPEILKLAEKQGLLMFPGAEFSASFQNKSLHILAYSFIVGHSAITNLCERHKRRRAERNEIILQNLLKRNMPLTWDEVAEGHEGSSLGRPHIALAMIKRGYVANIKEAFKKYLGDGKLCFAEGTPISLEDTVDAIHQASGLVVLAHPHLINNNAFILDALKLPFDGVECYYSKFSANDQKRWVELAQKNKLLMTGGSDFHGSNKPDIPLGCSWVNKETFMTLFDHYRKNTPFT